MSKKKASKPLSIKTLIRGDVWTVKIDNKPLFFDGKEVSALCHKREREMLFNSKDFRLGHVIHELFHAYSHYLYLDSSEIDTDQVEEIYAEWMEETLEPFHKQALELYKALTS